MNNFKVLYVEDDDLLREEFAEYLARKAGKVIVARDGAEGLKSFNACKPDLVVTDISMPVMDGLQMVAFIKESDPTVPIVFVTGTPGGVFEFNRFDQRIDKVMRKPVDLHEFSGILKHYATRTLEPASVAQQEIRPTE